MVTPYDPNNIFAKIIKGAIPAKIIARNEYAIAFYNIQPQAKFHALVIPTGPYRNFSDFNVNASPKEHHAFWNLTQEVASLLEEHYLEETKDKNLAGFRLITNKGPASGQEVEHFHVHILGGEKLASLNTKA
ncbi:HIT domain-containing protein [Acetobacteraceae bacterium]|nr:HIT domain-containing protein [Acetobacteraceae bacterium]